MLGQNTDYVNHLSNWVDAVPTSDAKWVRCFEGKRDSWSAYVFHEKCDTKGPTVTLAKHGEYVFGAFSDVPWSCKYRRKAPGLLVLIVMIS